MEALQESLAECHMLDARAGALLSEEGHGRSGRGGGGGGGREGGSAQRASVSTGGRSKR